MVRSARGDVLAAFSHIRCELLGPVVRGASMRGKVQGALSGGEGLPPHELCTIVRSAFASAFHVAQLEQQLYVTLFHTTGRHVLRLFQCSDVSGTFLSCNRY